MEADPGRLELFWLLRREVDNAMLDEMAAADGGMGQEEYNKGLGEILRTGNVLCSVGDFEICNLLRWGTLDLSVPLTTEKLRHEVTRLFGSWILLNAYAHPERCLNGQIEAGDELALQNLCEIQRGPGAGVCPCSDPPCVVGAVGGSDGPRFHRQPILPAEPVGSALRIARRVANRGRSSRV